MSMVETLADCYAVVKQTDKQDRFNRRYDLQTMIPRLAFVALRTAPMPYRPLKLADVAA